MQAMEHWNAAGPLRRSQVNSTPRSLNSTATCVLLNWRISRLGVRLPKLGGKRREHSRGRRHLTARHAQKHAAKFFTVLLRDEGCLVANAQW